MKTASLVFFYFGESSYLSRLGQETVPLHLALEDHDRAVLLHHETAVGPFRPSDADARCADVVDVPTKAALFRHLNDLGQTGHRVDLFVFSHGWPGRFRVSEGTYGENGVVSEAEILAGVTSPVLRMAWQCNCYGASLNAAWRRLGADVSAGTRGVNFYPTRFRAFASAWRDGRPFTECLEHGDAAPGIRVPVQLYVRGDAATRSSEWDGSPLSALTVLGKNEAAERYFRRCWLGDSWVEGKSGRENMALSSEMIVDGDGSLRK